MSNENQKQPDKFTTPPQIGRAVSTGDAEGYKTVPSSAEKTELDPSIAPAAVPGPLQSGQVFGVYQIVSLLGVGGMGEVYLAATGGNEGAERPCVVKIIRRVPGSGDPASNPPPNVSESGSF